LGLCVIPVLALLCGSVVTMTSGATAGTAAGLASLALLVGLRRWETRMSATGR